jgi:hypothetical protein
MKEEYQGKNSLLYLLYLIYWSWSYRHCHQQHCFLSFKVP